MGLQPVPLASGMFIKWEAFSTQAEKTSFIELFPTSLGKNWFQKMHSVSLYVIWKCWQEAFPCWCPGNNKALPGTSVLDASWSINMHPFAVKTIHLNMYFNSITYYINRSMDEKKSLFFMPTLLRNDLAVNVSSCCLLKAHSLINTIAL